MEAAGVEPASTRSVNPEHSSSYNTSKTPVSTPALTLVQENAHPCSVSDPDLQTIIDNWSALPKAVRAGIIALVKSTIQDDESSH